MEDFKILLKNARLKRQLTQLELSEKTGMAVSVLSKFELGQRVPNKEQLQAIGKVLKSDFKQLKTQWLAEKIAKDLYGEPEALQALQIAENLFTYKKAPSNQLDKLLAEADALKLQLDKCRPIPKAQLKNLMEAFRISYTYDSNRIEGNTLTLQETALVVDKGLTIGGKSMRDHLEAMNHAEAFDFIMALAGNAAAVNEYNLLQIHSIVLKSIDKANAGKYRGVQVLISGSAHTPPSPYMVRPQMEDYFHYYTLMQGTLHPLLLAADMHEKLVTIHPFIDGNGRTSRLIMNLLIHRSGFPMVNISGATQSRIAYYKALDDVQTKGKSDAFRLFLVKEAIRSLKQWLEWVGK